MSPTLLVLDTSSEAQAVGVLHRGELFEQFSIVGRGHSQSILPSITSTLEAAGIAKSALDGIVFGRGPGSFTGVRIAVGVVQGLGFGLDIPAVPVSTLACLAQEAFFQSGAEHLVVALTARADEVYFGSYWIDDGIATLIGQEVVLAAGDVPTQSFGTYVGVGSGWVLKEELERAIGGPATNTVLEAWPRARSLAALGCDAFEKGRVVNAADARPEYLREQVAQKPARR